jgi:predicted nucleotidyltransferase
MGSSKLRLLPAQVHTIILQWIDVLRSINVTGLRGFYLYGSIALGAYDEATSDVDFLAVTKEPLTMGEVKRLEEAYGDLLGREPLLARLEGNVLAENQLDLQAKVVCPQCTEGRFFYRERYDYNAVTLYSLRQHGVTLVGPEPKELLPPVSQADLRTEMEYNLQFLGRRFPYYAEHSVEYQAFGIVTLCRILYTVMTGEISDKRAAARFAATLVDQPWSGLVHRTLTAAEARFHDVERLATEEELLAFHRYMQNFIESKK